MTVSQFVRETVPCFQSTFGGTGTFADVLTSSYGLNLQEYGEDSGGANAPSRCCCKITKSFAKSQ